MRAAFIDETDTMRFTIGRFEVLPGGISVVPGKVVFIIDMRHPSAETLKVEGDRVAGICEGLKGPCEVSVTPHSNSDPMEFPDEIRARFAAASTARGLANQPIFSCAGHDARNIARLGPAGMIFIPCREGISHNEAESATKDDCAAAAQVISDVLIGLAEPV